MKKIYWGIVIVVLIIVVGGVYFYGSSEEVPKSNSNFYDACVGDGMENNFIVQECKGEMETELKEIIEEIILSEKYKDNGIKIFEIGISSVKQVHILLNCENKMSFEDDEEMVNSISEKIFAKYPNIFLEGDKSWIDLTSCSSMGGSADGINYYSNPTQWVIGNGGRISYRI